MNFGFLPRLIRLPLLSLGGLLWIELAAESSAEFFEKRIRPVLVEHCYECHSATSSKLKGGLRLDSKKGLLQGGETRAAVIPGNPKASLLLEAIRYTNRDLQMPPHGKLPETTIADLTQWVADGAFDPREDSPTPTGTQPLTAPTNHWAFRPLLQVSTPVHATSGQEVRSPIDQFVDARLTGMQLQRSPEADRRTLIRRVALDLTGLPPTPEEIKAYLQDTHEAAFERMVDRYLASPQYGERWARWWLDLARYADTNGQDENKVFANAWRYRDWVVRSFNNNQSFDDFLTEQLAGDLLDTQGVPESTVFDRWIATGFLVLGPKMLAEQDKPKLVMDLVDEQIDVVGRAFLGLTLGCARCHDHKFDPIPTRDYYALAGIFKSTKTMENLSFVSKFNERRITSTNKLAAIEAHGRRVQEIKTQIEETTRAAKTNLEQTWRREFQLHLAEWIKEPVAQNSPPSSNNIPTSLDGRWRVWWSGSSVTPNVRKTIRRLAKDNVALESFLSPGKTDNNPPSGLRLAPGKIGAAFRADGSNGLELPHSPRLEPPTFTLETWVKTSVLAKEGETRRWLVSKNGNEWEEGHYALLLDGDQPMAYLNIGGGRSNHFMVRSSGKGLAPNQWHQLVCTYDGQTLRLYVNGAPAGEQYVGRRRVPGSGPLALGRRPDKYIYFQGLLDEIHLLDRVWSSEEVRHSFEHSTWDGRFGALAQWDFNTLSEADQDQVDLAETYDSLFGKDGLLELPKDPSPFYAESTHQRLTALKQERESLRLQDPGPAAFALAVEDSKPVNLPIHIRGSHLNLAADPIPRGFPQTVRLANSPAIAPDKSGRLELARWLTSPDHPLTARVIMNRLWQAHFGEGLVRTPDNFGTRGEAPTHPELLDWLAQEFIRSGWNVKQIHRTMLLSATWRQSGRSAATPTALEKDPDNRWLSYYPRQRLEAEMVRDALLAVSGRLDAAMGGSLVDWKNDEYAPSDEVSAPSFRRSIYLPVVRDRVFDMFTLFDFANPSVGVARRTPTVVSHQALFFLNSPMVKSTARALAERLVLEADSTPEHRISRAYELALARTPRAAELDRALKFIHETELGGSHPGSIDRWACWCQVLLATSEFIYRD